ARTCRVAALSEHHAPRPGVTRLARPGSVRPVRRTRSAPAVHPALPRWVRARTAGPARTAHVGFENPRAPGGPPHRRCGSHDGAAGPGPGDGGGYGDEPARSEEHTSELQSRFDLVCRLLLEKKKNKWIGLEKTFFVAKDYL